MRLAEHGRLVRDVQQRLLAEARIEPAAREWQGGGVGANDPDLPVQPDQPREAGRAHGPAGVQLDGDHAAAAPGGQEAGGPPQAGADVEDTGAGVDAGQAGEGVDGGEAAVVILVELEQVIGGEWGLGERAAAPADRVEHLQLADRMAIVEVDDVGHGAVEACGHL